MDTIEIPEGMTLITALPTRPQHRAPYIIVTYSARDRHLTTSAFLTKPSERNRAFAFQDKLIIRDRVHHLNRLAHTDVVAKFFRDISHWMPED